MKKTLVTILTASSLFSYVGIVSGGDITVSIDSKVVKLINGEHIDIKPKSRVCYKSGNGKLMIYVYSRKYPVDNFSSPFGCFVAPTQKKEKKENVILAVLNGNDVKVGGVTVRGDGNLSFQKKYKKALFLKSDKTNLPLQIKIYTDKKVYIIKNSSGTIKIPFMKYHNIKKVEIYNNKSKRVLCLNLS